MAIVDVVAVSAISAITTRRHRLMERIRSSPRRGTSLVTSLNDGRPIRKIIAAHSSQPDRDPLARSAFPRAISLLMAHVTGAIAAISTLSAGLSLLVKFSTQISFPRSNGSIAMLRDTRLICCLRTLQALLSSFDHRLSADRKYLLLAHNYQKVSVGIGIQLNIIKRRRRVCITSVRGKKDHATAPRR
jgi:hypothetical protein